MASDGVAISYNATMEYEFEAIAKEIVISRLNDSTDAHSVAADVARAILVPAIANTRAHQNPHLTIASVCRQELEAVRAAIEKNRAGDGMIFDRAVKEMR